MSAREFYINLDFDVSLRPGGGGDRRELAAQLARDLAPAFLLAASPDDRLLLEDQVPEEFFEYLERMGFQPAAIGDIDDPDLDRTFVPYGWNESTATLASRYERPPTHPDLAIVRRVNSRAFSMEREQQLADGAHLFGTFDSLTELERTMRAIDSSRGFVVKANHSNASLGNRRVRTSTPTEEDRRVIGRLLEESGAVVLEGWQERVRDFVVTLEIERNGSVSRNQAHEIVNTAEGAFLGALFESDDSMGAEGAKLREAGRTIAAELNKVGYFGPACIDAYTWTDGERERLRPLVDLNCRLGMSQPFREVAHRFGEDRVCYGRFFSARRFPFAGDQRTFELLLGERGFDPDLRSGVLLASPLRLVEKSGTRVARRFAVVFVGGSRDDVLAMDDDFRKEFDR